MTLGLPRSRLNAPHHCHNPPLAFLSYARTNLVLRESGSEQVRYISLGFSLVFVSSVVSLFAWFSTAPDLSMLPSPHAPVPSKVATANHTDFIKKIKASLREDITHPRVAPVARPINASYGDGYGLNAEMIKKTCFEITRNARAAAGPQGERCLP